MNKHYHFLFFGFILILAFSFLNTCYAWDDCPYGKTNYSCKYPGECGRYIDTNHDGICDHCEPAPSSVESKSDNSNNYAGIPLNGSVGEYINISNDELENSTIKKICSMYNISQSCLIYALKSKINNSSKSSAVNEVSEQDLVDNYVNIPGSKLKEYSINQICNLYNINPEDLKKNLGLPNSINNDITFYTLKEKYGITPFKVKEAIVKCLINSGKISTNDVNNQYGYNNSIIYKNITLNENTTFKEIGKLYGLSPSDFKELIFNCMVKEGIISNNTNISTNIENQNIKSNSQKSLIDKIIGFLFSEINLKKFFK